MTIPDLLILFAGFFVASGAFFVLAACILPIVPRYRDIEKMMGWVAFGQVLNIIGCVFNVAYNIALHHG